MNAPPSHRVRTLWLAAILHTFTVPEGLTAEQIVQRLLETEALSGNIKEIPREGIAARYRRLPEA